MTKSITGRENLPGTNESFHPECRRRHRPGILTEVIGDAEIGRIPYEVETACFRISQEALTNIARHSGAAKAVVSLERRHGQLHLAIRDNGVGFDSERLLNGVASSTLGLRGMQERALAIAGRLEINSRRGTGTEIFVKIPLKNG